MGEDFESRIKSLRRQKSHGSNSVFNRSSDRNKKPEKEQQLFLGQV